MTCNYYEGSLLPNPNMVSPAKKMLGKVLALHSAADLTVKQGCARLSQAFCSRQQLVCIQRTRLHFSAGPTCCSSECVGPPLFASLGKRVTLCRTVWNFLLTECKTLNSSCTKEHTYLSFSMTYGNTSFESDVGRPSIPGIILESLMSSRV